MSCLLIGKNDEGFAEAAFASCVRWDGKGHYFRKQEKKIERACKREDSHRSLPQAHHLRPSKVKVGRQVPAIHDGSVFQGREDGSSQPGSLRFYFLQRWSEQDRAVAKASSR
jgi:hypothetical protein